MTVRVGINGFGRIGRNFFRAAKASGADVDFVAVNDLGSLDIMAGLLQRDSVHGRYPGTVTVTDDGLDVDGDTLKVLSTRNPADLPWGDLGVDVVIESTGFFATRDAAAAHLDGGAPRVIVSAPARVPTPPSSSESTTTPSIRPSTRWCPTPVAPPTALCPWSRCSMTPSAWSTA